MRTQSHLSLGDVPDDLPECDGECVPGGGLCCPDDPLDLVLQFLPVPAPHEVSLAALGIGGSPRRQEQPPPFGSVQENGLLGGAQVHGAGSASGGGGVVVWERDSSGLSSRVPEDMEAPDVDMFLADVLPDGGGEATVCNPSCDTGAMPAGMPAGGVHACGALGGGVVSNDAPPLLTPMSAGALHPYAFRAFDVVSDHAPPLPAPMPAGGGLYACGSPLGVVSSAPMPTGGGLHACGAPRPHGVVSNDAPPTSAGALHACRARAGVVPNEAPPLPASRSSSGCLSPTTSETESPAPVWQPQALVVPRKQRRPPVKCRKRPWSLDFPLHALPVVPPDNPVDNYGNDDAKNSCDNTSGGGIRRRRAVPRQRNRQAQRMCSHCHSPDTPQWRAGPDGPGTLCNACGIRYAANKLLPEYRPSTAPSFRSDQHSNRHRKVVKLREQKAKETLKASPAPTKSDESSWMFVHTYQQDCDIPSIYKL